IRAAGVAWASLRKLPLRAGVRSLGQAAALCTAAGLFANLPVLCHWYGSNFWGTGRSLVAGAQAMGVKGAVVFIRDYNKARMVALQERGVSLRLAQGAVEELDERWIDDQMADLDEADLSREERAEELQRLLTL